MNTDFNPSELNRRDAERLKRYGELLDFYHGIHWDGRDRRNEKRLTFNYAKVFVDKVTSYLMSGVRYAAEPLGDTSKGGGAVKNLEAALSLVVEDNNLEQLFLEPDIRLI